MEAVRKIIETEAQANRIVEEARGRAQEILSRAHQEAEKARQEILAQAKARRETILSAAREDAEAEAAKSDDETTLQIEAYKKAFENKRELAIRKAVELVLRGLG